MSRVEVLVAATGKSSLSFLNKIGVSSHCIVANQSDYNRIETDKERSIIFLTTDQRGVGRNRNLALALSTADYLLLADDDNIINKNYEKIISDSFRKLPDADALIFNAAAENPRIAVKPNEGIKRVNLHNFARFGAGQIAIRRTSWMKNPVFFSEIFGGGALYGSGEDVLFIRECLRKGYRMYTCPEYMIKVVQETSSWFQGYNRKFFYDEGALMAAMFPRIQWLTGLYFCGRFEKYTSLGFCERWKLMIDGMQGFRHGKGYTDI